MGNNIELLKQELIKQKELIESRGGVVRVANNNPSPYEITEGIKTVEGSIELNLATATPADVQSGKTFYAGTSELKTGTNRADDFHKLMFYNDNSNEELTTPDDLIALPEYLFAGTKSSTKIILNGNVQSIGKYCFNKADLGGFSFNNTNNLTFIDDYAFNEVTFSINFSRLPDSLVTLGDRVFFEAQPANDGYVKIPRNATNVGLYAFSCNNYCDVPDGINWNDNTLFTTIPQYAFYYQAFEGEFRIPDHITTIKNSAFYDPKFSKFTIPASVTSIDGNFYCIAPDFASKVPNLTMIFESVTPPTFKSTPFYYLYKLTNERFSIYVPDESLETYKAVSQLSNYLSYIKPMSQLPE